MQICQSWNRANSRIFQNSDIKFQELSRTYTDFQNFPGHWRRGFQNFQEPCTLVVHRRQAVMMVMSMMMMI